MAEESFKAGDAVKHKTGSQMMIYVGEDEIGRAICEWQGKDGKHMSDTFSASALEKYVAPSLSGTTARG